VKNAIDWIKSNPLITAAAGVFVIGIIAIAYSNFSAAPAFRADKADILKKENATQFSLIDVQVPLPNPDPNAEPDIYRVVINKSVIEKVSGIYNLIKDQYDNILASCISKNADRHRAVMLGNGQIWPDANPTQFFSLYLGAAKDYAAHFKAVFDYNNSNPWNMPRMVAGSPPPDETIKGQIDLAAFNYLSSIGVESASTLNELQARQLYAEQRLALMKLLSDRARSIHLYVRLPEAENPFAQIDTAMAVAPPSPTGVAGPPVANPNQFTGLGLPGQPATQTLIAGYPFQIATWALTDKQPTPDELWEGQMQLWVTRDIMLAIQQTNNVGGTVQVLQPDGQLIAEPACVLNSPIKRLTKLHLLPGFVGLHTAGGIFAKDNNTGLIGGLPELSPGGVTSGTGTIPTPSIYPTPSPDLKPVDAAEQAKEHFGITPTGRISNAVYDVRHVQLQIDIEWRQLATFIERLREINFMTVIGLEIENLDEYLLLEKGYVYGGKDVVRANLTIETLWFRGWTSPFMPKIVKERLLMLDTQPTGLEGEPGS